MPNDDSASSEAVRRMNAFGKPSCKRCAELTERVSSLENEREWYQKRDEYETKATKFYQAENARLREALEAAIKLGERLAGPQATPDVHWFGAYKRVLRECSRQDNKELGGAAEPLAVPSDRASNGVTPGHPSHSSQDSIKAEIRRQLKLRSSIECIGPPHVILNGEELLALLETSNEGEA